MKRILCLCSLLGVVTLTGCYDPHAQDSRIVREVEAVVVPLQQLGKQAGDLLVVVHDQDTGGLHQAARAEGYGLMGAVL